MRFPIAIVLMLFLIIGSSCKKDTGSKELSTPTSGKTIIAVDEAFRPIMEQELMVFQAIYKYARITPIFLPENELIKLLKNDSVNLIISSRLLSNSETEYFKSKSLFPRNVAIAKNAIAFLVHPSNPDSLLTTEQIKGIMTGKITRWKEINPASRLGDIGIVFDNKNSSTVRYAIDSICKNDTLTNYVTALDLNTDVIDFVAKDKNSLGLVGVSWVSDRDDSTQLSFLKKIKVVSVSKEKVAIYEKSYQPLQYYVFKEMYPYVQMMYTINAEPRNGLASGFVSFLASDKGQRIILKSGILPALVPGRGVHIRDDY